MKINKIEPVLKNIRDKYIRIRQMTEMLDIDTRPETYRKVLAQRDGLLAEIENEQSRLDWICSHWREESSGDQGLATLKSEIQLLISAAVALDCTLQDKLAGRIDEIKGELAHLGTTSKVALSYARHTT
jgi:hypothetical protein